jgi:hypothetical protein
MARAFELKKKYWNLQFGSEEAALTSKEAIQRFIIDVS